jgi:hypothetical protein
VYWLRTDNPLLALWWLATAAVWTLGGWLIATHAFRLEERERLLAGFGLGMVMYLWFINLLGHWVEATTTFIAAAFLVLGAGLVFAWKGERPILRRSDLRVWPWIVVGLILMAIFARLARGMGIFDEPKNLSIVSTMAAGDIPPHHYLNSTVPFAYHYGFQLLGSSLMRLGGLLPWSAFDLSKAIGGAYLFLMLALLANRYLDYPWAGPLVAGILAFVTGTRFLLFLAPSGLMTQLDALIRVRSPDVVVGMPLSQAIYQGVVLDDGPPAPFLFAFMGSFGWPFVMALQIGPSVFSFIILLLAWMLAPRMKGKAAAVVIMILFSFWAMVWESSYGLFLIAGLLMAVITLLNQGRGMEKWVRWTIIALLLSIPFAIFQGGTITETIRKIGVGLGNVASSEQASLGGFSVRWPPAIYSKHLGSLEIFSLRELFVAILELGPVVLFIPWITWWAWKRYRQGEWMLGTAVSSAWLGFLFPIFFSYEYDRDIVRFTEHALWIWSLILVVMIFDPISTQKKVFKFLAIGGIALMIFGGVEVAGSELSAASQSMLSEKEIIDLDSAIVKEVWDRLPPGSEVFDPFPWRATMISGRLTRVVQGNMSYNYGRSQEWESLRANPSVERFLANGFRYVYIDENWWNSLSEAARASLSAPCVQVVTEHVDSERGKLRRLVNLDQCEP